MIKTYICTVCGGRFPRENPRGRVPVACPEHRADRKNQVDKATRKGEPLETRPECCEDAHRANPRKRVCRQHKHWYSLKRSMTRKSQCRCADCVRIANIKVDLLYQETGSNEDGNGIYTAKENAGFTIFTR